ncbi:hypothetical protein [Methyloprofundus sedimenti]|uniref:hypothetical protein n=1 Tax=Methyloprofundus sedimenti TaxID=1420851 RepID=UPI00117DC848|nr:hypothetical protein [Methyloprofundus sedimenti]
MEYLSIIIIALIFMRLLSLILIRMLSVALSLLGPTKSIKYFFLSWFGPRGPATILFLLLILKQEQIAHSGIISTKHESRLVLELLHTALAPHHLHASIEKKLLQWDNVKKWFLLKKFPPERANYLKK